MTQSAQNIPQDNPASVDAADQNDISTAQPQASATTENDEQTKKKEYTNEAFNAWLKELDENQRKILEAYQKLNAQFIYKIADEEKLKSAFGIILDDYKTPSNVLSFTQRMSQKVSFKKAPPQETFISTDDTVPTAFEITRKNSALTSAYTGERPFDAYAAQALVASVLLGQPDDAKVTINISNATAEQKILIHKAIEDFIQNTRPDLTFRHATFNTRVHLGDTAKDSFNVASVSDDMDARFATAQEAAPVNVTENSAATPETATPVKQSDASVDEKATEKASGDALKRAFRDAATIPDAVYDYAKKTVMETGKASGPALRDILKHASEPVSHEKALRDKLVADGVIKKKAAGNGYDVVQRNWDHLKPSA